MYPSLQVVLPHLAAVEVEDVELAGAGLQITAAAATSSACCPGCGRSCARVHSRYSRRLSDTAIGGRAVTIVLRVRRFICGNSGCGIRTFAEQVEALTSPYARRTPLLRQVLQAVGVALAGRAGARLARVLGAAVSRSTLLRLVRALPDPEIGEVVVLGVDDFARRRGHVYGTVLVDAGSHQAIDLLADRDADSFAGWLAHHPGVQVICRDRAGAYAEGARVGAPGAIQVADRWHLWHNLAEHVEKTVTAHRGCLVEPTSDQTLEPAPAPAQAPDPVTGCSDGLHDVCGRPRRLVTRTQDRYQAVHELLAAGETLAAIARRLELDRHTVRRFARATSLDELLVGATSRASKLEAFKPYLHQRWNQGVTNAATLHAELQGLGWTGSVQAVRRYIRPFRAMTTAPAPAPAPAVPKPRELASWILTDPDHLDTADHARLDHARARCPELAAAATHVASFAQMRRRLRPTPPALLHKRATPRPTSSRQRAHHALQLRHRRRPRQQNQIHQTANVRTRELRPPPQTRPAQPTTLTGRWRSSVGTTNRALAEGDLTHLHVCKASLQGSE